MTADNVDSLLCSVGEVNGGRLSCVYKDACAGLTDVTVLSLQRDPDRRDTEAGHRDGRCFAAPVASFVRVWKTIHLTGLHYAVVSAGDIVKPDGKPYYNEDRQWFEEAAQFASMARLPAVRPNCRCRGCRVYRATAICGLTDSAFRLAACERHPLREGRARLAKHILRRPQRRAQ